jgi:hypothetical protein
VALAHFSPEIGQKVSVSKSRVMMTAINGAALATAQVCLLLFN